MYERMNENVLNEYLCKPSSEQLKGKESEITAQRLKRIK